MHPVSRRQIRSVHRTLYARTPSIAVSSPMLRLDAPIHRAAIRSAHSTQCAALSDGMLRVSRRSQFAAVDAVMCSQSIARQHIILHTAITPCVARLSVPSMFFAVRRNGIRVASSRRWSCAVREAKGVAITAQEVVSLQVSCRDVEILLAAKRFAMDLIPIAAQCSGMRFASGRQSPSQNLELAARCLLAPQLVTGTALLRILKRDVPMSTARRRSAVLTRIVAELHGMRTAPNLHHMCALIQVAAQERNHLLFVTSVLDRSIHHVVTQSASSCQSVAQFLGIKRA